MTWLVTGGAGYIGAHVVDALTSKGFSVVVVDDLSTGVAARVNTAELIEGSVLDRDLLHKVFESYGVTGVVHLAAKKRVDESIEKPSLYYYENVEGLRVLLDACAASGVKHFVFSSSAAVYGAPTELPITEDSPCAPMSPYGQTKLIGEWLVNAAGEANGIATMALRYFNVAGARRTELAERSGMNLVPMVLNAIDAGASPTIFGNDYATPDGTCVRDYIHVADVAEAHVAAARHLLKDAATGLTTINIGTGAGVSVQKMVSAALRVTGSTARPVVKAPRPGDPPTVVAAVDRAAEVLHWRSRYTVDDMLESAWRAWSGATRATCQ